MSEFTIQPNARCVYCNRPFYISNMIPRESTVQCFGCGSVFKAIEAIIIPGDNNDD